MFYVILMVLGQSGLYCIHINNLEVNSIQNIFLKYTLKITVEEKTCVTKVRLDLRDCYNFLI